MHYGNSEWTNSVMLDFGWYQNVPLSDSCRQCRRQPRPARQGHTARYGGFLIHANIHPMTYLTTEYLLSQLMKQDPSFQLLLQQPLIRKHTQNSIYINIIHFVSLIRFLGWVTIAMVPSRILAIAKYQNFILKGIKIIFSYQYKGRVVNIKIKKYQFIFISINFFYKLYSFLFYLCYIDSELGQELYIWNNIEINSSWLGVAKVECAKEVMILK